MPRISNGCANNDRAAVPEVVSVVASHSSVPEIAPTSSASPDSSEPPPMKAITWGDHSCHP